MHQNLASLSGLEALRTGGKVRWANPQFWQAARPTPWRYGRGFAAGACAGAKAAGTASSSISIPPMADADQL
jgi:hypothetical protein